MPTCVLCAQIVFMDEIGVGLYRCPVCGDEWDSMEPLPFDDDFHDASDGLRTCRICGDQYMTGVVCADCRRQQMIDKYG